MFLVFVMFIITFFFINYKWGIVAMPVLQFGMYSGRHYLKDPQTIYTLQINNKVLNPAQVSHVERDFIQHHLENFPAYKAGNEMVYKTMKKYLSFVGLARFVNYDNYNNTVTDAAFSNWFKPKLENIVHERILFLSASKQDFIWVGDKMLPVSTASKLSFLDIK
ncbi:MAG: hypothetical protein H7X88_10625 [Gloeobacteraceae cyanobacterium ES-bin-316]|nr:hypothetical protein [Ferruginibacter sp.]